jgi:hypothetical protein
MKRLNPDPRMTALLAVIPMLSGCDNEAATAWWLNFTRYSFPWDDMSAVITAAAVSVLAFRLLVALPIADSTEGDIRKALISLLLSIGIVWGLALTGISMTWIAMATVLAAGLALGHMEWQIFRSGDLPAPPAKEAPNTQDEAPPPPSHPITAPRETGEPAPATVPAFVSCPNCGQDNPTGFGYCTACGTHQKPTLWDL